MGLIVRVHAVQRLARIASPAPSRNRLASSFRSRLVCQQTEYPCGESNDVKGLAGYQQGLVVSNAIHFFKKGYAHSGRLLPTPSTKDFLSDVMKAHVRKNPMAIDPFGRIAPPKAFNLFFHVSRSRRGKKRVAEEIYALCPSTRSRLKAALINAKCVNACGKFPKASP